MSEVTRDEVIKRLKKVGFDMLADIDSQKNPKITMPIRTLGNVYFDEDNKLIKLGSKTQSRTFFNVNQAKKFMQTMLISGQIKELLEQKKPALSTRQLYYILKHTIPGINENTFDDQSLESDPVIEDVEVMIDALREQLNLVAVPKGVLAGPLLVESQGDVLDFGRMGSAGGAIPASVEDKNFMLKECNADYILVVEKFAVWNLLNQEKYWKKNNCILMTGKGQPARAERRLLARFGKELKIPIYVFADMDPWGYYIYSTYKQGSINLAFFSEKAGCPKAKYLGLMAKDIKDFDIPKSSWIKLNKGDLKRIQEISGYDWFKKKEWQTELKALKEFGYKVESDALVAKNIEFTSKEYLPKKIENKDFLD
jgi:DNA topoisomerase-6 subunit A